MTASALLSAIIFLPLAGGLVGLFQSRHPERCRRIALTATLADLFLIVTLMLHDVGTVSVDAPWISTFGIRYALAVDGISLILILLTGILGVICVLVSWTAITDRVAPYYAMLLAAETGVIGIFLATDLFLFYLFWELQAIPLFFLIGIWGHGDRVRAAVKFFLFSITGSLLMLVALISLYVIHGTQTGVYSFSIFDLTDTLLSGHVEGWLYAAFLLAFAIKIPLVPVHTWLPDAHTEAPTAGSVILAGLLLKTGMYALFRFAIPLFPGAAAQSAPLLICLGLVGLFYAGWIALAQHDMKRLVAYSSISHMGLMAIGVAVWQPLTLSGAILQMVNHGLVTSALFILVGMIDERIGSRKLADAGGLWHRVPVLSGFFLLFAMASMGLPGLNNFVGEILILVGTFREVPAAAVLGFAGLVVTLIYTLRLVQGALFGEPSGAEAPIPDLNFRETVVLVILAAGVLFIGLVPGPILELLEGPVRHLIEGAPRSVALIGF